MNKQIQARKPKYVNNNISKTINQIKMKLSSQVKTTTSSSWESITSYTKSKILDGRHLKNTRHHNSAHGGPIWMKFGKLMPNDIPMMNEWSKSKLEVKIQHGSRMFSKLEVVLTQ